MDILSEVLSSNDGAALLSRYDHRGPWGVQIDAKETAGLHYVESGECWLRLADRAPLRLRQGDVALLMLGSPHALSDAPKRRTLPLSEFLASHEQDPQQAVNARVVCAAQRYDEAPERLHPLMLEVPELIHIQCAQVQSCPTLSPCLRLLLQELQEETAGRAAVVKLLLQTFFMYVLRHWLRSQAPNSGWLGLIKDPRLARAVQALHQAPAEDWTVESLARIAGMSRPSFARQFRAFTGQTPLGYLTHIRMTKGAALLTGTEQTLAQIADRVGYASEFAFSRAFKRAMGAAPSAYRRARSAG